MIFKGSIGPINDMTQKKDEAILSKWYFGGLASAGAACCTHPLDLIKVHFQTAQTTSTGVGAESTRTTFISATTRVIRHDGVLALYNGLTASLLRQLTYSTTRFGMYEVAKQHISPEGQTIPFYQRVFLAGVSGAAGGLVGKFNGFLLFCFLTILTQIFLFLCIIPTGSPADMINVRMQNDIKLPIKERRNYKNAIDGLIRVYRHEGVKTLFNGASMATSRAIMMTIGQVTLVIQIL